MRNFILIMAILIIPSASHAAGLRDLISGASSDARVYVNGTLAIFACGIISIVGPMILSAFGGSKIARLVANGSYLAAVGIFMGLAMMLFKQFCDLI